MCFDELVDREVVVDGVDGDDGCLFLFWAIVDFFFRMGVLGASLEIFDFFPGVPGPFAAFDDLLILFRTEEDLFFVFGTGLLSSCSAFDDLRAFAFADFPVFAGGRFA